ncbi:MAG TPA: hypothetical protein VFH06_05600 [Candidatus Saccharimonadales bacterium]|nr:hypothetical protein [Candidatus Saccharimonadales bacterium]
MDKIEYIAQVRNATRKAAESKSRETVGRLSDAVERLAEFYASISEAEGLPRYEFDSAIFERAYEAATYQPDLSGMSFKELLEISSLGPNYQRARSFTPAILKTVLANLRRQQES